MSFIFHLSFLPLTTLYCWIELGYTRSWSYVHRDLCEGTREYLYYYYFLVLKKKVCGCGSFLGIESILCRTLIMWMCSWSCLRSMTFTSDSMSFNCCCCCWRTPRIHSFIQPFVERHAKVLFPLSLRQQLEDAVLASPGGVSKMMDLLADSREMVRNGQCAHLLL